MQSVKPRVPRPLRTAAVLLVVASLVTPAAFAASLTPSRPGLMRQVQAARERRPPHYHVDRKSVV